MHAILKTHLFTTTNLTQKKFGGRIIEGAAYTVAVNLRRLIYATITAAI